MIDVQNLTLTYPSGKGVFELNFQIDEGEVVGYLGPNGAGKTTTIRALLGFMHSDSGSCSIRGLNCREHAPEIQRFLGYIPGEITFPDNMRGDEYLRLIHDMRGGGNGGTGQRQNELLEMFELDPRGKISKFSKGMKQKLGIVAAFMHAPEVLILDEPTSGLDPLMQNRFVELIRKEREDGKTILMSSHSFEEVEKTCDNVLIIRDGRIIHTASATELQSSRLRKYVLRSGEQEALAQALAEAGFTSDYSDEQDGLVVMVQGDSVDKFVKTISEFGINDLSQHSQTLEELFMRFYQKGGQV